MTKRSVFVLIFLCGFVSIRAQDLNLTDLLNTINITDIVGGINISDELKRELIDCIDTNGNSTPAYDRCPNGEITLSDALKIIFPVPEETTTSAPSGSGILDIVDQIKDTVIVNPINTLADKLRTAIKDGTTIASELKANLTGAREEAEVLLDLAGNITATKPNRDPHDPYQDISEVLINKNKDNIKSDPAAVVQNRNALIRAFANTDTNTIRRYGSSYNPLVPNVILLGFLKTLADV